MNTVVKAGVLALSGAIGGLIGYLVGKEVVNQYYDGAFMKDAEEYEEYVIAAERVTKPEDQALAYGPSDEPRSKDKSVQVKPKGEVKVTNYSEMFKQQQGPLIPTRNLPAEPTRMPRIISEEKYSENTQRNFTLTYYEVDDVLVNEMDVVITNVEAIVGPDALLSFGAMSGDPDVVFVENPELGIIYEIIREHDSYEKVVLGIEEDPIEVKRAAKATKVAKVQEDEAVSPKPKAKPRTRKVIIEEDDELD